MGKNYFKDGKWTEKLEKTVVLTCVCTRKYIKTRDLQVVCLQCAARQKKG